MSTPKMRAVIARILNDNFNLDNVENLAEFKLVRKYIDQLEADNTKQLAAKANNDAADLVIIAEVAMYNHYFADEVIKQLPETCGDLFGMGEDCFVMELYPFADLIVKHTYEAHNAGEEFNGVFVYEAMAELAELWIATVLRQQITICAAMAYEMPELDEYELDVVRVVRSHTQ